MRKHLSADALLSAFAMFSLKDPSLLAFEKRRLDGYESNLKSVYKMNSIPSDTQMRTILDPIPPDKLRPAHNGLFGAAQRGKALEKMVYLEDRLPDDFGPHWLFFIGKTFLARPC